MLLKPFKGNNSTSTVFIFILFIILYIEMLLIIKDLNEK